jgi:hypothetical protein
VARDGGALGLGIGGVSFAEIYTARLGTGSTRHIDSQVSGLWSGPGWSAAAALHEPRQVLQGYARQVRDREFAAVRSSFAAAATARSSVTKVNVAVWPDFGPDNWGGAIEVDLPAARTDYYASEGGARWQLEANHNVAGALDSLPTIPAYVNHVSQDPRVYVAGRSYTESWNKGVFGPAFPAPRPGLTGLTRTGDQIDIAPVMYSDDQGRAGSSSTVGWFQRLTRDGEIIQQGGRVGPITVAPGDAQYEVFVNTGRKPLVGMATQNQVAWTFRSGPGDGVLPVSVLRFRPALDDHNRAVPGDLPIEVHRQPGATPATVTAIQVQYSTDDGVTWTSASVAPDGGDRFTARVPATGYVSLQTSATLSDGGTVSQKILRAYLSDPAARPIGR